MDNYIFYRWLHNVRGKDPDEIAPQSDWETPFFARIKGKKSKRISPYTESIYGRHMNLPNLVKISSPYTNNNKNNNQNQVFQSQYADQRTCVSKLQYTK